MRISSVFIAFVVVLLTFSCQKESYDNMQRNSFVKFFGSQYSNAANDLIEDNGAYVFVGFSSVNEIDSTGLIIRTNEFGNTEWQSSSFMQGSVVLNGITIGNDLSYVVCGYHIDTLNNKDLYVAKFSSSGVLIWENEFGGIMEQEGNKIVRANDGGYVIIGNTTRGNVGNGNPQGSYDMMAVKIDENGDSVLTNQFGGPGQDFGNDIVEYGANNYMAVGTTGSFPGFFESYHGGKLVYMVMLSNQLGEDDVYCWGDLEDQQGNSISYDNNGNFLIAGSYLSNGVEQGYILNIDGTQIRTKLDSATFSTSGSSAIRLKDVRIQTDGTICATGFTIIDADAQIGVYKINSSDFSVEADIALGYSGSTVGNRLISTQNGGFLVSGSSLYESNSKATLIKLNENVEF